MKWNVGDWYISDYNDAIFQVAYVNEDWHTYFSYDRKTWHRGGPFESNNHVNFIHKISEEQLEEIKAANL